MRKCSEECIPCCDYCKYVIHKELEFENNKVLGAPIFCKLHLDEEHTKLVRRCSYCEGFWCINHEEGAFEQLAFHYTPKAKPKFIICDEIETKRDCHKCVYEVGCHGNPIGCKRYKRDAPDGGYYG